jgi:integrase/recombinase XerD
VARRKRQARKSLLSATPAAPGTLRALAVDFLEWTQVKNFSMATTDTYERYLLRFIGWCDERAVVSAAHVTRALLERYQRHLFYARKANGRPLSATTQLMCLSPLKSYFRWAVRAGFLPSNPAADLDLPRMPSTLPRLVLAPKEVEAVLAVPDVTTLLGVRDRALLETLYSTGLRRKEAAELSLYSFNFESGTVMVRAGKGQKDRLVPISRRALDWVQKYFDDVRPQLLCGVDSGRAFVSVTGEVLSPDELTHVVRRYIEAGTGKSGSCHVFRHSMATAMLEGGADIRFIQAMLGHARLDTTAVYTRVAISTLKAVHEATHPGARAVVGEKGRGEKDLKSEVSAGELLDELADDDELEGGDNGG